MPLYDSASGSVSKVEMVTPMALIYKVLFFISIHVCNTTVNRYAFGRAV